MSTLEVAQTPSSAEGRPGAVLALWVALAIVLHGSLWVTGFEPRALRDAVDYGEARAETSRVGEVSDDVVRKAIALQRDTLPFWTTLARLGDFVVEPIILVVRAVSVATIFAAIAALTGRPIGFQAGLLAASWAQGFWVLSLLVKVGLAVSLRRGEIETSAALILPAGQYPAALVLLARQADPFLIWGWLSLAWGGYRRRQVNLLTAILVCLMVAGGETLVRIGLALVNGAGMRLTILPG